MRKIIIALLLAALATQSAAAQELAFLAGERSIIFRHIGGYLQPSPTLLAAMFGDSRTANAGGITTAGTTFTASANFGAGYAAWIYPLSGNKLIGSIGYNYGVGAQTTAAIAARMATAGTYCNDPTVASTATCFTATFAKITAGTYAVGATTITLSSAYQNTVPVAVGNYVGINGVMNYLCQVASFTGTSTATTSITLKASAAMIAAGESATGCITTGFTAPAASGSTGTELVIIPPANMNNFGPYTVSGGGQGGSGTDSSVHKVGGGAVYAAAGGFTNGNAPSTDPAHLIFFMGGTNDANLGWAQTIQNLGSIFTGLGPNGSGKPNKILVVSDETTRGLGTGWSTYSCFLAGSTCSAATTVGTAGANGAPEVQIIPSSATCNVSTPANCMIFVHNSAILGVNAFFDETSTSPPGTPLPVYFLPCGAGTAGNLTTTITTVGQPCGTSGTGNVGYVAGSNDGVALVYCNAACLTAHGGYPPAPSGATHYFSIDGTGIYTFNYADAGAVIGIYYRWINNAQVGPNYLTDIHEYLASSSCSNFTAASGHSIPLGAQCKDVTRGYPWVLVGATYAAIHDTTTSSRYAGTLTNYPLPFTLVDGLHPLPYGGALMAQAQLNAATTGNAVPASPAYPTPTVSNFLFTGSTANVVTQQSDTGTYACTGARIQNSAATTKNYYIASAPAVGGVALTTIPQATADAMLNGAVLYFPNTNSGIAAGAATIDCVNTGTGVIHMTTPATAAAAFSSTVFIQARKDPTSLIGDGVFSYTYGSNGTLPTCANCGTPSLGTTLSQKWPSGWTNTSVFDSGSVTAIANGMLGVSYGMEQNPLGDGYDDMVFTLQGYAGTGSPSITLAYSANGQSLSSIAIGDQNRAICEVLISAGPNGHLYGFEGVQVKYTNTSTAFVAPGGTAGGFVNWVGAAGGGSTDFSDASLKTGAPGVTPTQVGIWSGGTMTSGSTINVLKLPILSLPSSSPVSAPSASVTGASIQFSAGDPVSATVRVRRCSGLRAING